jgi:DNA-binding XRE family transcriptional regulator
MVRGPLYCCGMTQPTSAQQSGGIRVDRVRLRILRVVLGLTQKELGLAIGVSRGLVSAWECGDREIAKEHIDAIADLILKSGAADTVRECEGTL